MLHCLYALTSHADVTRFEIEDGVLRTAAAELVSEETTVDTITVDLGVHLRRGPQDSPIARFDAMLMISGATEIDVAPSRLDELLAEVAVVGARSKLEVAEIARLEKPWIGTTTPGPKITAHLAADAPQDRSRMQDLATSICASLGDVGCRVMFNERSEHWPTTTSMSFWFPNNRSAGEALDGLVFDPLLEHESSVLVEAIEHRLAPNPNRWGAKSLDAPSLNATSLDDEALESDTPGAESAGETPPGA